MIQKLNWLFAIFLLLSPSFATAQSDTDSLARYFDDGGRGDYKFCLKIGAIAILNGEQALHLEIRPFKRTSIELGIGRLTSDYLYEFEFDKVADTELGDNVNSGRVIGGRVKWYAIQKDLVGLYYSLGYYNKRFDTKSFSEDLIYSEFGFDYGIVARVAPHILVDFSVGFKLRTRKIEGSSALGLEDNTKVIPIALKVGYAF